MRATIFHGPGDVRVETVPDPALVDDTDAIVRITHACICGSDLWPYRGESKTPPGSRIGHEWMGIVEETGAAVRTIRKGDRVFAPFSFSDGTCEFCRANVQTSCVHGGFWGSDSDGGQGEAVRSPFADATLVKVPADVAGDEAMLAKLLPLTDVLGTGHHAAVCAGVRAGSIVAVVGDGAVGLCAVLAAKRLGAEQIVMFGHHPDRLAIARRFGASDEVAARGDAAKEQARDRFERGFEAVLECVGNETAMDLACAIARPGGAIGYVGVPVSAQKGLSLRRLFSENIALRGGVAPVRAYQEELMSDVLAGSLDASAVFDLTVALDGVPQGYAAMNERRALKAMVRP